MKESSCVPRLNTHPHSCVNVYRLGRLLSAFPDKALAEYVLAGFRGAFDTGVV